MDFFPPVQPSCFAPRKKPRGLFLFCFFWLMFDTEVIAMACSSKRSKTGARCTIGPEKWSEGKELWAFSNGWVWEPGDFFFSPEKWQSQFPTTVDNPKQMKILRWFLRDSWFLLWSVLKSTFFKWVVQPPGSTVNIKLESPNERILDDLHLHTISIGSIWNELRCTGYGMRFQTKQILGINCFTNWFAGFSPTVRSTPVCNQ